MSTIALDRGVRHGLALAWRGVLKIRKNPEQLVDVTIAPIILLVMFTYLFGGALAGSIDSYLQMLVPGILVMNILQASMTAGVQLNTDVSKGVFDRFRAMPIARSAPLVGAVLADVVRYVVSVVVLLIIATVMGFRVQTGPVELLIAAGLAIVFGLCFCWASVFVGMLLKTPQAVQGIMIVLIMPLTFGSNVFVGTSTMPGWLKAWADISPVSLLSDALRGLLNGGAIAAPLTGSLVWMVAAVAVFFPLAMWAYRRRV
ncbi:oleandomycin transport system permease protein [Lentzea xinjiangensis]|uniref:Transport permease protein n=1 Tax=Lentzea xinjiangensis TaxID=402600 RepID=A0A1H9WJ71_9PSEU|nr:ABC transporter permease [Lentzea xinjiangensis]SES33938.1 oleandomycin transport system permease protein [Lentzea xinjiangensis]